MLLAVPSARSDTPSPVGGGPVSIAAVDGHYSERLQSFQETLSDPKCNAIIEGRVVSVTPEHYDQWTASGGLQTHVGRAIEVEVVRSWKTWLGDRVTFWTHGGSFDPGTFDFNAGRPFGCGSSGDIKVREGSSVIVTLVVGDPGRAWPVWTYHARKGFIDLDLQCVSFRNETERQAFSLEVLEYMEARKAEFVDEARKALSAYPVFENDGGAK